MRVKSFRLITIALLVSMLTPTALFAQPELRVVQDTDEYYDGVLTSLQPIALEEADVIFVNGILNSPGDHWDGLAMISGIFTGLDVIGVYNATDFNPLTNGDQENDLEQAYDDLKQGQGFERIHATNPAVDTLLTYLVVYDNEVIIIAHSQGAAITSAALREFALRYPERMDRLRRVSVITLGGFAIAFPEGPQYWHVVFSSDIVPVWARCLSWRALPSAMHGELEQAENNYWRERVTVDDGLEPWLVDIQSCDYAVPHLNTQHFTQHLLGPYLRAPETLRVLEAVRVLDKTTLRPPERSPEAIANHYDLSQRFPPPEFLNPPPNTIYLYPNVSFLYPADWEARNINFVVCLTNDASLCELANLEYLPSGGFILLIGDPEDRDNADTALTETRSILEKGEVFSVESGCQLRGQVLVGFGGKEAVIRGYEDCDGENEGIIGLVKLDETHTVRVLALAHAGEYRQFEALTTEIVKTLELLPDCLGCTSTR